jgi:hypothetical protein
MVTFLKVTGKGKYSIELKQNVISFELTRVEKSKLSRPKSLFIRWELN